MKLFSDSKKEKRAGSRAQGEKGRAAVDNHYLP